MRKVFEVALREFVATVATKGFLIAALFTPFILVVIFYAFPKLMSEKAPRVEGEVAIVDLAGEVAPGVRSYLAPEAMAKRWQETAREVKEQVSSVPGGASPNEGRGDGIIDAALGQVPRLTTTALAGDAILAREKAPLVPKDKEKDGRLALVVVHRDAVAPAADGRAYGSYDLYIREKLDDRLEREIRDAVRDSIVAARVRVRGLDRQEIETLTHVDKPKAIAVTSEGEHQASKDLNVFLPAGFMILLLSGVMSGGQYLMTSTVEEKSSRVVEVLLSAVSPLELMTGKILGQMLVGFVILALYAGLGIWTLLFFAMLGYVDLWLVGYLIIFYVIAYVVIGSLMGAIGAAVNDMREAQTLLTPVMLLVMIPWMLWLPITRDPGSTFSTVMSFIPPVNTFVMLLRMTSTAPPPLWQVWTSIAIGVASAAGALWFAAKVFRIGLLMYGKPPNLATLIRWARTP